MSSGAGHFLRDLSYVRSLGSYEGYLKIMEKIRSLAEYPGMGSPLLSALDVQTDYRFLVCGNYLIFYGCEERVIFVVRVLYGRRNYMRILFGDLLRDEDV